jgi:hypothetical protein
MGRLSIPLNGSPLRRVGTDDETLAGLSVLARYDDDLANQSTRLATSCCQGVASGVVAKSA